MSTGVEGAERVSGPVLFASPTPGGRIPLGCVPPNRQPPPEPLFMARVITGTGSYLPAREVQNAELADMVENFDAERAGSDLDTWIRARYGVELRHWAEDSESTGDMAAVAAERALSAAGVTADDIDVIVMSTATSDHVAPHSVSVVQEVLGCDAVFHQLQDACPGFLNGLIVADSLMSNPALGYKKALVIAGEKMTHIVDKRDFRMIGLFADGAGAVVLEDLPVEERYGFRAFYAGSDGAAGRALRVPTGGSRRPLTHERLERGEHFLISDFREVYPFAVRTIQRCVEEVLNRTGSYPGGRPRAHPPPCQRQHRRGRPRQCRHQGRAGRHVDRPYRQYLERERPHRPRRVQPPRRAHGRRQPPHARPGRRDGLG